MDIEHGHGFKSRFSNIFNFFHVKNNLSIDIITKCLLYKANEYDYEFILTYVIIIFHY